MSTATAGGQPQQQGIAEMTDSIWQEELTCPLCMEELEDMDRDFFACKCHYQVCLWCVHHIRELGNGRCPACRKEYADADYEWISGMSRRGGGGGGDSKSSSSKGSLGGVGRRDSQKTGNSNKGGGFIVNAQTNTATNCGAALMGASTNVVTNAVTPFSSHSVTSLGGGTVPVTAQHHNNQRPASSSAAKVLQQPTVIVGGYPSLPQNAGTTGSAAAISQSPASSIDGGALKDVRVIQRNLVCVIGLPQHLANAETLERDHFSRFGTVVRTHVSKQPTYSGNTHAASYSAYVTFGAENEAKTAILKMDGVQIGDKTLRCSYGTTKYCSNFLKGIKCPKHDCLYLHCIGASGDSFTKEAMMSERYHFHTLASPSPDTRQPSSATNTPDAPNMNPQQRQVCTSALILKHQQRREGSQPPYERQRTKSNEFNIRRDSHPQSNDHQAVTTANETTASASGTLTTSATTTTNNNTTSSWNKHPKPSSNVFSAFMSSATNPTKSHNPAAPSINSTDTIPQQQLPVRSRFGFCLDDDDLLDIYSNVELPSPHQCNPLHGPQNQRVAGGSTTTTSFVDGEGGDSSSSTRLPPAILNAPPGMLPVMRIPPVPSIPPPTPNDLFWLQKHRERIER